MTNHSNIFEETDNQERWYRKDAYMRAREVETHDVFIAA